MTWPRPLTRIDPREDGLDGALASVRVVQRIWRSIPDRPSVVNTAELFDFEHDPGNGPRLLSALKELR